MTAFMNTVKLTLLITQGFPGGSVVTNLPVNAGDAVSVWVGKIPWIRNGNPLHYSCLGNPMDRGVWQGYNPWGHTSVGHNLVTKKQLSNRLMCVCVCFICIYLWLQQVFFAAWTFSSCRDWGLLSSCGMWTFSLWWLLLLWSVGPRARGLQ